MLPIVCTLEFSYHLLTQDFFIVANKNIFHSSNLIITVALSDPGVNLIKLFGVNFCKLGCFIIVALKWCSLQNVWVTFLQYFYTGLTPVASPIRKIGVNILPLFFKLDYFSAKEKIVYNNEMVSLAKESEWINSKKVL